MGKNANFIIHCATCGKSKRISPSAAARAKRNFCSRNCKTAYFADHPLNQHLRDRVKKVCKTCGKEFEVIKARENKASFCSASCNAKSRVGPLHGMWKGDDVSYAGLHHWVSNHKGKASFCQFDPMHKSKHFEWANISGEYKRDLDDWMPLCISCHHAYDNISERAWITRKANLGNLK